MGFAFSLYSSGQEPLMALFAQAGTSDPWTCPEAESCNFLTVCLNLTGRRQAEQVRS